MTIQSWTQVTPPTCVIDQTNLQENHKRLQFIAITQITRPHNLIDRVPAGALSDIVVCALVHLGQYYFSVRTKQCFFSHSQMKLLKAFC